MKKEKTIQSISDAGLCHGCGTCVATCPHEAITMTLDEDKGIYLPTIDDDSCNECSVCLKVCPGHDVDFEALNRVLFPNQPVDMMTGVYLRGYTGYANDNAIRYNGASGGVVTGLLVSALESGAIDGALVCDMQTENPLEPSPFVARSVEDIARAAGSKYCPVPLNTALEEILTMEGSYAIVGLPCHLHGIRKFEQYNKTFRERIKFHIGLFCGYTYSFLGTRYLLKKYGINKKDVAGIDYRGAGWPGNAVIRLKDKTERLIPVLKMYELLELTFRPERCSLCCDHMAELADISFGDAWLPQFSDDPIGTSEIITRNAVGEELLSYGITNDYLTVNEISRNKIVSSQTSLLYKKSYIQIFMKLAKLQGKPVPRYTTKFPRLRFFTVLKALFEATCPILGTRRYLWKFIPFWHFLYRKMNSSVPDLSG